MSFDWVGSPWINVAGAALAMVVTVQAWRRMERWSVGLWVTIALMTLDLAANKMRLFDRLLLDYATYVIFPFTLFFWWKSLGERSRARPQRSP